MLAQGGTQGSGGIMTPAIAFGDNLVDALHAREHCWVCLPCGRSGAPPPPFSSQCYNFPEGISFLMEDELTQRIQNAPPSKL